MCPVGSSVTFVLALDVDDSPGPLHYPYQCPHCDGMVTDAGTNPGLLTTDDLVEFPRLLLR